MLRFLTLVLAALGLAPGAAHVLEMPVKSYSPQLYSAVTSTMYQFFGSVGAAVQVDALLSAGLLTWLARHTAAFRLALSGTLPLARSLVIWGVAVAPVNAGWADALKGAPDAIPSAYARLRSRWEYGHAAAFFAWFVGFCSLQLSVFRY